MPYGGSGANKAPLGPLNPILLGQKKDSGQPSLLAQHLGKRRDDPVSQRPQQDNQQMNYNQQGNYGHQGGYNQQQGGYGQSQGGYGHQQGGYGQKQSGYTQQSGSYGQHQGSYGQQQDSYNQNKGSYGQQKDSYNQGSYNQQSSYNQNQGGSYNQQQGGSFNQGGSYNQQQGGYNQQRDFGSQQQRPPFENRNQQPKPLMSLPSQPPYNQYSNPPPPPAQSQPSSYGPNASSFPMLPAGFNAPPPPPGPSQPPAFPMPGFGAPPPPPAPQNPAYSQPPPPFGGPPLPPVGSNQPQEPPPPVPLVDSKSQPPPPTDHYQENMKKSPPRKRKKRSRWGDELEKTEIPGMPASLPVDATEEQKEEYLLHFKIEEISIKLRSGDLGIPANPEERSPSPEPIYNTEGKRLNTREYRVRKRLEEERHNLIQDASTKNADYKPPIDYRPPTNRIQEKVMIPQDANPAINFIGLLIGPRGNTLKKMEKDTNCKIIIRGKGSVKEGKGRPGFPLPGENEPLHALVTGPCMEDVKNAVKVIEKIIKDGVETPEGSNELRKMQLRELAALNGTLIEEDIQRCRNCGATDHRHWECTEVKNVTSQVVCTSCGGMGHIAKDCVFQTDAGTTPQPSIVEKAKMDDEYMSLMAELGVDAPASKTVTSQPAKQEVSSAVAAPIEQTSTNTVPKSQTSSAPWSAEPKPLMSANTSYNQRTPGPRPLMPSVPSGSGPGWTAPRGTPPSGGPRSQAPPWTPGAPTPPSSLRGPPQPTSNATPSGPPPGAPPPWQATPPPPWQQPPPGAAAFPPTGGFSVPPLGSVYPPMGQTPPIPPWSAPPPPPPPPSK